MKSVLVVVVGVVMAAWMAAGRWLFGVGGSLTAWYLPAIGLTYALLHWWIAHRIAVAGRRGRRTGRAVWVALALSWACAIGFGLTVPDEVGGELVSILSSAMGSQFSTEMSIALCNPLGIIAFALAFAALGFALAAGREPRPEEDEYPGEGEMVPHPLARG